MLIAEAALATLRDQHTLSGVKVVEQFTGVVVVHERAGRDPEFEVLPVAAVHLLGGTGFSGLGFVHALEAKVVERGDAVFDDEKDRTTVPAVAAGRAALGNELLPAEGNVPIAAVAGPDCYLCTINEHEEA
jgi:hypothetical protein